MFKKIMLTAFIISAVMLAACGNSNTSTNVTTAPTTAKITTTTSPPVTTTVATEVTTTTTAPKAEVETSTCLTLDNSVTEPVVTTTVPTTAEITTTTSPPVTTTVATEITTTTTAQTTITTTEPIVTTAPTTVEQTTTTTQTTTITDVAEKEYLYDENGNYNDKYSFYNVDAEIETLKLYNEYRAENGLPCNYTQNDAWASYADRLVYYMAKYMQLQHSMSVMEVISSGGQDTGEKIINGFKNSPKHNDLLLGVCNGYHFDIDYVAVSSFNSGAQNYNVIILEDRTFEEYFNLGTVLVTENWFENEFYFDESFAADVLSMSNDEKYTIFIEKGYDKYYPHLVR